MKSLKNLIFGQNKKPPRDPNLETFFVKGKSQISIGCFTYGDENLRIRQWGEGANLCIGKFCSIADDIQIFLGGNHRTDWLSTYPFGFVYRDHFGQSTNREHPGSNGNVSIGNDVWIGSGATIMSGIKIGDGAVIAANSTVVRDVAPYQIVGGNPAEVIKTRFSAPIVEILLKLRWWDLPIEQIRELIPVLCAPPDEHLLSAHLERYIAK
jgi:acetyltransferase-like isoleucine patch superfamily enzyme